MDNKSNKLLNYYNELYSKYGEDVKSLGWSPKSQQLRFSIVERQLPPDTRSVLDIGCGLGHFAHFLKQTKPNTNYTGWDINTNFLRHCQENQNTTFKCADIITTPPKDNSFEAVIAIGTLNTAFGTNEETIRQMLHAMYNACSKITCLSATSKYVDPEYKKKHMWFYDPAEIFSYAKTLTPNVDLIHSYLPHDFLIVLHKHKTTND